MAILKVFDDTRNIGVCRSCQAQVTWCELTSGKRMPFDGHPTYVKTEHEPETRRLVGHIDSTINQSHFATCPDADRWRRR